MDVLLSKTSPHHAKLMKWPGSGNSTTFLMHFLTGGAQAVFSRDADQQEDGVTDDRVLLWPNIPIDMSLNSDNTLGASTKCLQSDLVVNSKGDKYSLNIGS